MPTYEYECTNPRCRHRWELFQSIKAAPERRCPRCARTTASRLIGMGAAILSGGRGSEPGDQAATPKSAGAGGTSAPKSAEATTAKSAGTSTPAPAAAEAGTVNATHPAREGRGAGNLRDAIRRQRKEPAGRNPTRTGTKPARPTTPRGRGKPRG